MDTVNCPMCGEFNLASAKKCRKCGAEDMSGQEAATDLPAAAAPKAPEVSATSPKAPKPPGAPSAPPRV